MSKSVKLPDDVYERLKKISEQTNVPMGEVVDSYLSGGEDIPAAPQRENEEVTAKDAKEFMQLTGFAGQMMQLMTAMKQMNSPINSVQDLVSSYKAVGAIQELFGGRSKNEYIDKIFEFLLSNPGFQTVVSQIIMKGAGSVLGMDANSIPNVVNTTQNMFNPNSNPYSAQAQNNGNSTNDLSIDDLYKVANAPAEEALNEEDYDEEYADEDESEPFSPSPKRSQQVQISPQQLGVMVRQAVESGNDEIIKAIITGAVGDNPQAVNMLTGLLAQARARAGVQH